MEKPRIIVIGIDGGTWNTIKPLAEKGDLPTFKKLMSSGAFGTLLLGGKFQSGDVHLGGA